jgi:hypothetical protein
MGINFRQIAIGLGIALFFLFFRYRWPTVNKYLAYIGMFVGALIIVIALIPMRSPPEQETKPVVIFPKFALYWIQKEGEDFCDLGIFIKLFNADTRAYTLNSISFATASFSIVGRGSWYIQRLIIWPKHGQTIEDRYIKAGSEGYYKILLPMKMAFTPANGSESNGGPPPGLLLKAKWTVVLGQQTVEIWPEYSATYEHIMTQSEWLDLGRPTSKLDMNNLHYQPF